jgi:hypothetical protein
MEYVSVPSPEFHRARDLLDAFDPFTQVALSDVLLSEIVVTGGAGGEVTVNVTGMVRGVFDAPVPLIMILAE